MDREKVVRDLRYLKSFGRVSNNPQITEIAENAIALLKEQEAVKPQLSMSGLWYECPICHRHLLKDRDNYCARCGRRLNLE